MKICGLNLHLLHLLSTPQSLWLPKGKEGWNSQLYPLSPFIPFIDDLQARHCLVLPPKHILALQCFKRNILSFINNCSDNEFIYVYKGNLLKKNRSPLCRHFSGTFRHIQSQYQH